MKILGTYLEGAGTNIAQPAGEAEKINSGQRFDNILERTGKRDDKERVIAGKIERKSKIDSFKQKTVHADRFSEEARQPKNDAVKVDEKTSPVNAEEAQQAEKPVETEVDETVSELEDKLLEDIAAALSLSVEQVKKIIDAMNIRLEDLTRPEVLSEFMQTVKGVAQPAELLMSSEIMTEIKAVRELAASFQKELAAVNDNPKPDAGNETANTETTNTEGIEGAQIRNTQQLTNASPVETEAEPMQKPVSMTAVHTEAKTKEKHSGAETGANQDKGANAEHVVNQAAIPLGSEMLAVERTVIRQAVPIADTQEVIRQISEKINVLVKADTTEIKMTLKPETLGEVRLKIITENGIITAQFQAESQRVKEIIESSFNQLRDTLTKQGLSVANLSVSVGQEQSSQMEQFRQERSRSAGRISRILSAEAAEPEEAAQERAQLSETQVDYKV